MSEQALAEDVKLCAGMDLCKMRVTMQVMQDSVPREPVENHDRRVEPVASHQQVHGHTGQWCEWGAGPVNRGLDRDSPLGGV